MTVADLSSRLPETSPLGETPLTNSELKARRAAECEAHRARLKAARETTLELERTREFRIPSPRRPEPDRTLIPRRI